jgi:hypothetical protein
MKPADKIQEIRNSEESVRRRWFWVLSLFFSLVVIIIWGFYIQMVLPKTKNAEEVKPTAEIEKNNTGEGFFGVLGRGLKEIGKQAETGWQVIGGRASSYFSELQKVLEKKRSVDLQPETDLEFAPAQLEEIPATKLPSGTQ